MLEMQFGDDFLNGITAKEEILERPIWNEVYLGPNPAIRAMPWFGPGAGAIVFAQPITRAQITINCIMAGLVKAHPYYGIHVVITERATTRRNLVLQCFAPAELLLNEEYIGLASTLIGCRCQSFFPRGGL